MITFRHKGNFDRLSKYLSGASKINVISILERYAREGVLALAANTPVDSGLTASSWGYELHVSGNSFTISWTNSNREGGAPVAILIQYGHGTGTGGYVPGRDYINPVMRPIFDRLIEELCQEVSRL